MYPLEVSFIDKIFSESKEFGEYCRTLSKVKKKEMTTTIISKVSFTLVHYLGTLECGEEYNATRDDLDENEFVKEGMDGNYFYLKNKKNVELLSHHNDPVLVEVEGYYFIVNSSEMERATASAKNKLLSLEEKKKPDEDEIVINFLKENNIPFIIDRGFIEADIEKLIKIFRQNDKK